MNEPFVSVIMSIYNEKVEWIHESIDSILNQTFSDFEFIIINDNPGRIENTQLLEEYQSKDNRILIISNKQNIGLTKSLNKGIKIAKGKYIARMDADDISLPERFEKQVAVLEKNTNIIVCATMFKVFGSKRKFSFTFPEKSEDIKELLIKQSCMGHPTVMIRKETLIKHHILYDENFVCTQDYKLWIDLSDCGDYYNIQEVLLLYRISKSQISNAEGKQQNFSIIARREYITKILKEKGYTKHIEWDNITLSTLKEIKKYNVPTKIVEVFYLSLKKYKLKDFNYFIFSLDYIHFPFKTNIAIISRFFIKRNKLI
jgi:glycosyltransferase involved in cell wall biosynthesis